MAKPTSYTDARTNPLANASKPVLQNAGGFYNPLGGSGAESPVKVWNGTEWVSTNITVSGS